MKTELKTINKNIRITPTFDRWLDQLVFASPYKTVSEYLTALIFLKMRELILEKAVNEGKVIAGKEIGMKEQIAKAVLRPKDIEGLFPKEKEDQFKHRWAEEIIKLTVKFSEESGIQDGIKQLSKDDELRISELIFETHQKLGELNNALYEAEDFLRKDNKE